jgi:beta-barrel assembly-enhancing protease
MLRKLTAVWCLLAALTLNSQTTPNMSNYQPARSSGTLPPDILKSTTEKYEKSKQQINTDQSDKMQKAEDDFYLQTNYSVDQILHSGTIMVGDSMSLYVNRVADTLLAHDPELRAQINIYVLRTPVVNAFATDRGSIFITIGLLTRLHNEAELAFVLAHEIIHYKRRHVLVGYIEGMQMQEGEGKYSQTTAENRYLKKHSYARSQETQADEEGFDLLVKSNYDPKAAMGAFDILAMADFPFTDTLFTKSAFEGPRFVFPSEYYTDTIKRFKIDETEEDHDLSTHPSVPKRRKNIKRRLEKLQGDTTGQRFLVSESMFYRVRAMAMFEEAALHVNEGNYKDAVYINYAIQKSYPDNYYLQKEMLRAMFAITIKKNTGFVFTDLESLLAALFAGDFSSSGEEKPVGEIGRATAFITKTDKKGWNIATVKYAWKLHKKYPEDKEIESWTVLLFREMTVKNELKLSDFERSDSIYIQIGKKVESDTAMLHKLKKDTPENRFQIVLDHMNEDSLNGVKYWEFAFVEEFKDSTFEAYFKAAVAYADSLDGLEEDDLVLTPKERKKKEEEELSSSMGMKKVVVINPVYQSYDDRIKNGMLDVRKSISGKDKLMDAMKETATRCGMECEVLDPLVMDSTDVEKFNDMMILNDWFATKGDFKEGRPLPVHQEEMNRIAKKYNTNYFMWSAYYTSREKRKGVVTRVLSLAFVPLAPATLYRLFTPREDVYFVAVVYDITTGEIVWGVQREFTRQRATDSKMKLQMYDMMNTLSSPKKKQK